MNIISVIPISRSKLNEELSYFTASDIPIGAIVSVPIRSKIVYGIVINSEIAQDLKIAIKKAPYKIRKLNKVKVNTFFPIKFIECCKFLADYYATNIGVIISSIISSEILDNISKMSPPLPMQQSLVNSEPIKDETFIVQGDDDDRISSWRSLIRQEFARKKSIAVYLPTIDDAKTIWSTLHKGIEEYIFLLHGGLTPKKIEETWNKIANTDHPVIIVATISFAVMPRGDIETVIIERENSRGWIMQKNPYLDGRHCLEIIARKQKQSVILADSLLRTETLYRHETHEISEVSPFKWRSISTARDSIVNMKTIPFRVLSTELETLMETSKNENTNLFLLTARRGLATTTVCEDCGTIVTCKNCSAPVILHLSTESGKNYFMCHKCGHRRSAEEKCSNCDSWKLMPLGVGIDRVNEEIKIKFPNADVVRIDADTTKTDKQILAAMEKFRAKPGSILLGTEMALPHITEKLEHIAIVSLDSLLALPDFRIQEKIMYALIRLRSMATRTFMVQTRKPEEKIFDFGIKGNLSDFHKQTLDERKQFKYPPYSLLVKITISGKKEKIAIEMAGIQHLIEPHEIDIFPAFTSTVKGNSVIHGLIKIEPHAWPDMDLISKLRSLSPSVSVKINPESLL